MTDDTLYLDAFTDAFRANKRYADGAIEQVSDEALRAAPDAHTSSIAALMKHVAGNLRSRWTDVLTTDGEKPTRHRDQEFVDTFTDRDEVLAYWERGWQCLFDALTDLSAEDLTKTVTIRGKPLSVPHALARSLGHTCYHVGQIVQLARLHAGENWQTLSIPKGESEAYNRATWGTTGAPPA